eukprot:CAMPEP_0119065364 /NCGR_PEP_ID=MMETSP1178-20130426/8204_1 /TAXON_ID=33656 /ORGANISM="unid sp, Strain CCMP2000" /LENGTH=154 /DNA_ID=CAMNT_0007046873 /DNA_START=52 /DNA_END=512 /DNA_ORIENTATION=-
MGCCQAKPPIENNAIDGVNKLSDTRSPPDERSSPPSLYQPEAGKPVTAAVPTEVPRTPEPAPPTVDEATCELATQPTQLAAAEALPLLAAATLEPVAPEQAEAAGSAEAAGAAVEPAEDPELRFPSRILDDEDRRPGASLTSSVLDDVGGAVAG